MLKTTKKIIVRSKGKYVLGKVYFSMGYDTDEENLLYIIDRRILADKTLPIPAEFVLLKKYKDKVLYKSTMFIKEKTLREGLNKLHESFIYKYYGN